jgi:pyruvate dehydrogenase E2 component (dihydrolipoamide acetyltransferase)
MAVDVIMPQMGESIFEGTVTKWLKKPGDKIKRDEPLLEISTDKVDAEIPSPAAGVLKEIKVVEGQTVPIQTVVAVIDTEAGAPAEKTRTEATSTTQAATPPTARPAPAAPSGAAITPPVAATTGAATRAQPSPSVAPSTSSSTAPSDPAAASAPAPEAQEDEGGLIRSSPLVRRLADEHHIDLSTVRGTGAGGRISKKDVLDAIAQAEVSQRTTPATGAETESARGSDVSLAGYGAPAPSPTPPVPQPAQAAPQPQVPATGVAPPALETAVPRERLYFGQYEVQPMSIMRQRIAEHMVASKRVSPHVYSVDEADLTAIAKIRAEAATEFEKRHGTKLTYMPFFVRACVEGLRAFPIVNASLDGTNIVLHKEINIGIAVALDWGLIVPVIKRAEEKNFLGIQRNLNDLAERARTKKLKPEEVQESTFSITNPGVYGGLMGLPIINQPNVAILGIGAIQKRPVVVDNAIAIRSMVYLTLSYDHRVVDGAVAHQFMGNIKKHLESWCEDIL